MLLLRDVAAVKLERPVHKILRICPAFKNTFIMVTCEQNYDEEKLVHIDAKGKVLWDKSYKDAIDTFGFFKDSEVIVMNTNKSQLDIIDLTNYNIRTHAHDFSFPDTSSMDILTFYDTRYLCIQESGLIGEGKLILTYYSYTSHSFDMISQFRSQEGEWTYGNMVSKLNNQSKVAWWEPNQTEELIFHFWSLSKKATGELTTIKIRNTLANLHGLTASTICIADMWEIDSDRYNLVCHSNANNSGSCKENYVIDAISGIVREAKFRMAEKNYNCGCLHFFNLGTFSIFHMQDTKNGYSVDSRVYYIDNKSESIAYKHAWKATNQSHFFLPGYDPNALIEAEHENLGVSEVRVISKRLMTIGEIYLHLMLGLNEDFDDDLLMDGLEALGYINL